jgi:hypothetical protein
MTFGSQRQLSIFSSVVIVVAHSFVVVGGFIHLHHLFRFLDCILVATQGSWTCCLTKRNVTRLFAGNVRYGVFLPAPILLATSLEDISCRDGSILLFFVWSPLHAARCVQVSAVVQNLSLTFLSFSLSSIAFSVAMKTWRKKKKTDTSIVRSCNNKQEWETPFHHSSFNHHHPRICIRVDTFGCTRRTAVAFQPFSLNGPVRR